MPAKRARALHQMSGSSTTAGLAGTGIQGGGNKTKNDASSSSQEQLGLGQGDEKLHQHDHSAIDFLQHSDLPSFGEWFDWQEDVDVLADSIPVSGRSFSTTDNSVLRGFDKKDNLIVREMLLSWRLRKPYLIYCCVLGLASLLLLVFTAYENVPLGMRNAEQPLKGQDELLQQQAAPAPAHGDDPSRPTAHAFHHVAEIAEILIGLCLVLETAITWYTLGSRSFFASKWCLFDLTVSLLTLGIFLLSSWDAFDVIEEYFEMPILILRFSLQPLRLIQTAHIIRKARQMQITQNSTRIVWEQLPTEEPKFRKSEFRFSDSHAVGGGAGAAAVGAGRSIFNSHSELPAVMFDEQYLCFGEALIIDVRSLLRGTSKRCACYGFLDQGLCTETDFVVKDFEIWKFVP
eukprot:g15933.t1